MFTIPLLIACVLVTAPPATAPPVHGPECGHALLAARLADAPLPAFAFGLPAGLTDVHHYFLDIELDPWAETIVGSNTMTVESLVDGLTTFRFRLANTFLITELTVDSAAALWNRLDADTIEVTLGGTWDTGEIFDLYVAYDGTPTSSGFGSFAFRFRSGAPEAWSLSEPWFAHTWWPVKDDVNDKTTADLWYTVPDLMVVASNGRLEGVDTLSGSRSRYRWHTDYPTADYLYCIAATNYDTFGTTWNGPDGPMPLDFYIYPLSNNSTNRNAWLLNVDMLDVFSSAYGTYPFAAEKYGMAQVGFSGGMEHQTMTSQGGFWESITAHELAHQWWGDMVTCATWHDIWLNEGFATWSEAWWFGNKPGAEPDGYLDRMESRRPGSVNGSVYVYDTSSVSRIFSSDFTYRKGAWVVHMLRGVLGDDDFFATLDLYRDLFEFDSATTDDLRLVAETVAGRDLTWFFDEWIFDIGAPAYRSAWRNVTAGGQTYVEIYIQQVQSGSYPTFIMPLSVATSGLGGPEKATVWNDAPAEHLLFPVSGSVNSLELDPDDWTLHTQNTTTAWIDGPPKIAATSPAPGSSADAATIASVTVTFHESVVIDGTDVTLSGDVHGSVPIAVTWSSIDQTATITPDAPLSPDHWTVTIHDSVVDPAGHALDGELDDPLDPVALPSGDGLAGGAAQFAFDATGLPGDIDGDGSVGFNDLLALLSSWGSCAGSCPADLDGDNTVGFSDLLILLTNWS